MIYIFIYFFYDLERNLTLFYWTKKLIYYYQEFEWSACLNYAIVYFTKHQNAFPKIWYSIDSKLVIEHKMNIKWNLLLASFQSFKSSSKKSYESSNFIVKDTVVCQNWNHLIIECKHKPRFDEDICERRHVYSICLKHDHKMFECSDKSKSSNWLSERYILSSSSSSIFFWVWVLRGGAAVLLILFDVSK